MEMKARFDTLCACCKTTIHGGTMAKKLEDKVVDGLRMMQWGHVECPPPAVVAISLASETRTMTKAEAKAAKAAPTAPVATARRVARTGWRPCGYPGCRPTHCDDCRG